nr:hypothetical protein [Tanacetum cinerariifolium]
CCFESSILSGTVLNAFTKKIVAYEKESDETHAVKKLDALCTPESFVTRFNFETVGGDVYYILKVYADVLLVKGNVYDSVDDCVVAYIKYVAEVRFVVRRSCQKRLRNEDVKQKVQAFVKRERKLTYLEQAFIVKAASVNIGATRAHHLLTGIKGSYFLVHGTTADEVYKYNYIEFGDVVSFDATFKTNKYNMVFVPFTAIDNHKKCVTVAAGLLKNKTTKSYIWLLKAFIKPFGKAPSIVVTDQDEAMRNAIEAEFVGSKHRLCMWHITQKLPAKICAKIYDETDFKENLNKIVWNMYIGLEEFEYRWGKLMEEFKLENHKWLTKMFNIRSTWIPAYFIDSSLCGLMRTKTRSESENSLFSHFTNFGWTLMNFMNCFEMAMEKQRHNANVEMIPQQYILRRWTKNLIPATLRNKRNGYGEKNVVVENFMNKATSIVDYCVHLLSKDEPRLGTFVEKLKSLKKDVEADCPNPPSKNKTDNLDQLVGVSKPPVFEVNNPTVGSTKGRKKRKQLKKV